MKRRDLIRHLTSHGCAFDREGRRHTIYRNSASGRCAAVPRHREVQDTTARSICDELMIPRP
ncbi:MAG TPA: type II toxin-antitoxin system HicA family toxin [Planctomycetota bacterium]